MRVCAAPNCDVDLDAANVRADADCCSGACRAAKSRAKRSPEADASARFWQGLAAIEGRVGARSDRRDVSAANAGA